jgi:2',3'-cyclic-nucleotide 2'-phosphodiesterase (5'-nucleotidase family)
MLRILHTNDFHGTLDDARQRVLAGLRESVDLYFDCGDCIKAGNLSIPLKPDPVWPRLAALNCTASVLGNRESHPLEGPFKAKIAGATHPLLCGNMVKRSDGERLLPGTMLIEVNGVRVGVVAVMVAMVTQRMATRVVSQFLWNDPLKTAAELARQVRPHVDCVIALTHIGFKKDQLLAEQCPEIDLILGGHSHTVLQSATMVGKTAICQGGSHGRFAGIYEWDGGLVSYQLAPLV